MGRSQRVGVRPRKHLRQCTSWHLWRIISSSTSTRSKPWHGFLSQGRSQLSRGPSPQTRTCPILHQKIVRLQINSRRLQLLVAKRSKVPTAHSLCIVVLALLLHNKGNLQRGSATHRLLPQLTPLEWQLQSSNLSLQSNEIVYQEQLVSTAKLSKMLRKTNRAKKRYWLLQ